MSAHRPDRATPAVQPSGDAETARLMRLTALAPSVPPRVHQAARKATEEVWRQVVAARRRRRRALAWAAALTFACLGAFLLWRSARTGSPAGTDRALARVEVIRGTVFTGDGRLAAADTLAVGARVETGAGRVALRLADGPSLRVDEDTRFTLLGNGIIAFEQGGLYVDSGRAGDARPLEIRTPFGVARNIGTQFEARLDTTSLRLRVREGTVEVDHRDGSSRANVGDELTLFEGSTEQRPIAPSGQAWRWPLEVAPVFDLEGSSLARYLEWLVRETGWTVRFDDPALAVGARSIILHGSLEGFAVEASLDLVLASCGLTHRVEDGTLVLRPAK